MKEEPGYFYEFDQFRLDPRDGILFYASKAVELTPKAINILTILVENRGRVVSKDELMSRVWPDSLVEDANLSHHIFKLRRALEAKDCPDAIKTVSKRGYRFDFSVRKTPHMSGEEGFSLDPAKITEKSGRTRNAFIFGAALVFAIVMTGTIWFTTKRDTRQSVSSPGAAKQSIAVLPFINESGDESVDFIADGITEALIGRLSQMSSILVRPRSAVYSYKEVDSIESAGRELQVGSVLSERVWRAMAAAERALAIDDGLAEAHSALALEKFYYEWDFAGAKASFKRAIELNSNYSFALESYAIQIYESDPKRIDEALALWSNARRAVPLSPSLGFWRAAFYYFEGQQDEALRELKEIQNLAPGFSLGIGLMGAVYREKGMNTEYVDHWLRASALEGGDLTAAEAERLKTVFRSSGLRSYEIEYAEVLKAKSLESMCHQFL